MLNNELQFTSLNISSIQSINCFLSTFRSVFFIYRIIIANESEFPDLVRLKNTRLDVSKRFEHWFDLSISPIMRNIFDVNVVDKLSLGFLHIFWLEFKHLTNSVWLALKGYFCILNGLETHESVSSWFYFFNFAIFIFYYIDWCFHTFNTFFFTVFWTVFFNFRFKNIM